MHDLNRPTTMLNVLPEIGKYCPALSFAYMIME